MNKHTILWFYFAILSPSCLRCPVRIYLLIFTLKVKPELKVAEKCLTAYLQRLLKYPVQTFYQSFLKGQVLVFMVM